MIFFIFSVSQASLFEIEIEEVAIIQNERYEFRVLLAFDFPERLFNVDIDYAEIVLPPTSLETEFAMEVYSLITSWQPGVTWNLPWNNEGGDYDIRHYHRFIVYPALNSSSEIFLNVTELLRQIQRGVANYGFIIKAPDYEGEGFEPTVLPFFQSFGQETIEVYYTITENIPKKASSSLTDKELIVD
jgi:hypothetical protein